ncbi:MAG TPA: hypothetical protein ENK38_02060 [Gammaproteobacteria bacterium]|nr:hypothetical protein [Gammaproteobacteria bacterium]
MGEKETLCEVGLMSEINRTDDPWAGREEGMSDNPVIDEIIAIVVRNPNNSEPFMRGVIEGVKKYEREACAKACEDMELYDEDDPGGSCAAIIRARSEVKP